MRQNTTSKFWQAIGVFVFFALIVALIKRINDATSTKLYDEEALKDLDNLDKLKEIYPSLQQVK